MIFEQRFPLFGKIRDAVFIAYSPESVVGKFFLYHLTDFLWAYALAWAMLVAAKRKKRALALCSIYCTFTEVLQLWPWLRATFDFMDILCQLAGILLAYIGYIKIINE